MTGMGTGTDYTTTILDDRTVGMYGLMYAALQQRYYEQPGTPVTWVTVSSYGYPLTELDVDDRVIVIEGLRSAVGRSGTVVDVDSSQTVHVRLDGDTFDVIFTRKALLEAPHEWSLC